MKREKDYLARRVIDERYRVNTSVADPLPRAPEDISFQQLADAMPQMVWSTLPDGSHDYYNAQWYAFTGVPPGSTDGEGWSGVFHPEDQARAWEKWRHSLATGDIYEIEYRLRHHSGQYRWVLGRALPIRDDADAIVRWAGTCTDIDEQKQIAELNQVLSRELSHRIKNIFAVINGLIGLSARRFKGSGEFARQLQARIAALGRAHEYVRPHSEESAPHPGPTGLKALLTRLLSPYPALDEGRLTITGDDHIVDDRGATPIGLVFHELATNATKYGALSVPDGRIVLTMEADGGTVRLRWQERGGPLVEGPPKQPGFGTRLSEISVVQQLGGELERDWAREGLTVSIALPQGALSRS